jgi:lysophospholipase L1-like esterase
VECPPFTDCPNGMGYPQIAARQLKAQGFTASLVNYGIPTAVISPTFQTLGQQFGRTILGNLLVNEMPFIRGAATVVTVFTGGNDVNTITAALGGGAGAADQAGFIDSQVRAWGADYASLVGGIRGRAGSARIILLNLPNLAGFPFLAGAPLAQRQAAQRASVGMTAAVNALRSDSVLVIDLMCDARAYNSSNYSADGFHPNDAGYTFIAGEVVRAVTSTSYPAPAASCGFMTLVPS